MKARRSNIPSYARFPWTALLPAGTSQVSDAADGGVDKPSILPASWPDDVDVYSVEKTTE